LRPDLAATLGPDRFLREIELAARLTHPHILPLHDSGEADGFLFYVMPYIKGESLRDKLAKEGELPVPDAVRILRDVVDALAHAHAEGVVHRDIKPDNVLLPGRHAVVTDFGVAKAVSEATGRDKLTTAGVALGTPSYMAPEQAVADPHVDHRADIYAVGAMGYEMLTGRPRFVGATPQGVLASQVTEAAEPVTQHRESVPAPLATLVMKCLEKKPADRWQSADQMLPQLEALLTPSGGITPTGMRPAEAAAPARRFPKRAVILAAGVAVAAAGVWLGLSLVSRGSGPPVDENVVAVLPFRVTGGRAVAYLREGMIDALHAKFTGEGGPRAVDPRTVMSAWHELVKHADEDLSVPRSVQLARRLGAGRVLLGDVLETDTGLTLSATLDAVPGGRQVAQASVTGMADSLPALIDHLVAQLLSLQAGVHQTRLNTLSDSLEAVRAYLEGQQALRAGRAMDAVGFFDRAIGIDSTFALAAMGLARAGQLAGNTNTDAGVRGDALSWRLRDRLSPRDKAPGRRGAGSKHAPGHLAGRSNCRRRARGGASAGRRRRMAAPGSPAGNPGALSR
jgi:hypothetical protein